MTGQPLAGRVPFEGRIYPVPVKRPSAIKRWPDWPDDVRDTLLKWNGRTHSKGLHFHSPGAVFKCPECEAFCYQPLAGHLRDVPHCDDCLIDLARAEDRGVR